MGAANAHESAGLLIWSRRADELTPLAVGWRVITIGTSEDAGRHMLAADARVAVVDARQAFDDAIEVVGSLAAHGGAVVALVSQSDLAVVDKLLDAGATQFLAEPWTAAQFAAAVWWAALAAERSGSSALDQLARDLAGAIARGEVDVLFQPQVAMASGAIVGVEALARWEHPTLGTVGAEALFAAAGRAGLATALSDHVQTLALGRAARWPASLRSLRVSVNITAADLSRADFADRFVARVRASGFAIDRVTAEVTETELIAELVTAAGRLATLRAAGCRVAIDDFGTGYSSLAYLQALPLDYVKIDRALTQNVTGSTRDRVIVRAVIAMAHALELTVIAEGVETAEQRDLLAEEGCDLYQGFLCAEALDEATLVRLVGAR